MRQAIIWFKMLQAPLTSMQLQNFCFDDIESASL